MSRSLTLNKAALCIKGSQTCGTPCCIGNLSSIIYIPSFECPVAGIGAGRAARHELRQQHLGATARNMRLSAQRNKRNI